MQALYAILQRKRAEAGDGPDGTYKKITISNGVITQAFATNLFLHFNFLVFFLSTVEYLALANPSFLLDPSRLCLSDIRTRFQKPG